MYKIILLSLKERLDKELPASFRKQHIRATSGPV